MSEDLKILTLTKRWSHHTSSGGYDRLLNEMPSDTSSVKPRKLNLFQGPIGGKIWKRLVPASRYTNHYNFPDFAAELNVLTKVKRNSISLVHSLYAEDQLNILLNRRKWLNAALVGTFHLPSESEFIQRIIKAGRTDRYKALDAAIVVAKSMISDYEEWVGQGKVFYVPHGIDTKVFTPGAVQKIKEKFNVLIVGGHGRDWVSIKTVIRELIKKGSDIKFSAVVPSSMESFIDDQNQINIFSGIPEKKLINLYREADLLLIPVTFASANNSLLEALACGTPVISTDTGGIPDYLDDNCGWMFQKGEVKNIIRLIEELAEKPEVIQTKSKEARKKSLLFDWKQITMKVDNIYKTGFDNWQRH